ncbi:MAG: sigma 54-interacting transcriptional regulator [Planctomycetia bacterium]
MARLAALSLALLLGLLAAGPADAGEGPEGVDALRLVARDLATAPTVDGDLSDWPEAAPEEWAVLERADQIPPGFAATWKGPADASARVRMGADAQWLYLAAEILDDRLLHPGQPWFHGDSLELFLNTGLTPGVAPPTAFAEGCWQVLLMPHNPQLSWGVVYRGQQVVFGSAGLQGVRVAHRLQPGGYVLEAALPRKALDLVDDQPRRVGFALALTDADEQPLQETYLSWNRGFDLFTRPDRFGELELPRVPPAAPLVPEGAEGPPALFLAILVAVVGALLLAGPGARRLAALGPTPKAVTLCLTGLLGLVLFLLGTAQARRASEVLDERMRAAAPSLERVALDAARLGALDDTDEQERARRVARLLQGERIARAPVLAEVALVGLPPLPASAGREPEHAVPLGRVQRFLMPAAGTAPGLAAAAMPTSLRLEATLEARAERRPGPRALGTLVLVLSDGTQRTRSVQDSAEARASGVLRVTLEGSGGLALRAMEWTPAPNAPRAWLTRIVAVDAAGGEASLPLSGLSDDGIPLLAQAQGPRHGHLLAPGETVDIALPALAGADRLWVVLDADRAYPALAGNETLATLEVEYAQGEPTRREVQNGVDLVAERLPSGVRRPAGMRSRPALRWSEASGATHELALLALALDPAREARRLRVACTGPGGRVRVLAVTQARTLAPMPGSPLVTSAGEDGTERLEMRQPLPAWRDLVHERPQGPVRLSLVAPTLPRSTTLTLSAPPPPEAEAARTRTRIGLLTCLAVGLFTLVLLAVDALGRARQMAWRLALSVLAAALVPLGATTWLVGRTSAERAEAEQAARARAALRVAADLLQGAQQRTQELVRQVATELAEDTGTPAQDAADLERLVRITLSGVLPEGRAGVALAQGSDLPALRVASEGTGLALAGPQVVAENAEQPGFVVSPWDGLLAVSSARAGRAGRWARVTLGVRMDDAALEAEVLQRLAEREVALAVVGEGGAPLAVAGPGGAALGRSLAAGWGQASAALAESAEAMLPTLVPARQGDPASLALLTPLGRGSWLALGVDRGRVEALLEAEGENVAWLGLFALVLVATVASLVARRVAGPLRSLVRVTERVRLGDFDTPAEPASADEVGNLTVAFDQMRLDLKARIEEADWLRGAQDRLAASLDLAHRARVVLELVQERFAPDVAVVLGATSPRGPAQVLAAFGQAEAFGDRPFPLAAEGWLVQALSSEGLQVLEPGDVARRAAEEQPARRLLEGAAAWTAIALRAGAELQGLLLLGSADRARMASGEQARVLGTLAPVAGVSLNNSRLYRLAALDEVSRLPGPTAFEAGLRADIGRSLAGGPSLWLVRVSLDHLERVTLRRGVEAGHALVRAASEALRAVAGGRPLLGRITDDELAARLPGLSREEALAWAARVRDRLRGLEVAAEHGGEVASTPVSVGLACLPGDASSLEFLMHAAGRAVARARSEGGDRVLAADQLESGAVELPPFEEGAIFRNERMVRVVEAARRAARSDASVLVTGETGTGKEVIASLVHRRSPRADRPFVSVNCAAFPETLLESELFGYERGAFTGAERRHEGRFEAADQGTLFLDEVGEMSAGAQVKLLRVLQERQFTRLGGNRPVNVDVRIVAATNKDLEACVKAGTFREDLYYRLNVIRLEVPPLRERREEIPPLVEHFLREFRRRNGRGPASFSPAAMDVLYRHPWPGNVRELKNVVERCAVLCDQPVAGPEHLQLDAGRAGEASGLAPRAAPRDGLSERQRKLLDHLALHGRATNADYQALSGTSARTGLRDLQDLIDRGLIVREGRRRGATYRLA